MAGHKARVDSIRALIAGSACISASPMHAIIESEFNEVYSVRRIRRNSRRRILEILHSARALDTLLRTFVQHHGCLGSKHSMGGYLVALKNHSVGTIANLSEPDRAHFQASIVNKRNKYLHEAGAFPIDDQEVNIILSDMDFCISTVLSL